MTHGILLAGNEPISSETLKSLELLYGKLLDVSEVTSDANVSSAWIDLSVKVDHDFFQNFPSISTIICCATGSTNIDLHLIEKLDVKLFNLSEHSLFLKQISATAEHAWALLMSVHSKILQASNEVRMGKWDKRGFLRFQLKGLTLGIIGFGRLGRMLARYGTAFGMNVLICDQIDFSGQLDSTSKQVGIDVLLKTSDYIILSSSVSNRREQILSSDVLRSLKPGASLINISRGVLVDEEAVLKLLDSGGMGMYASDVVKFEDLRVGDSNDFHNFKALSKHQNVILTPHMGGYCKDARVECEKHLVNYVTEGTCSCR